MRMYDLILKKKQGGELSTDEIRYMIEGFTEGSIPDYQMSAMTMAICFRGMTPRETVDLTLAMRDSGDVLDLSGIKGVKVDKHSTGGVGDKTSLALTPIIAALGVPVVLTGLRPRSPRSSLPGMSIPSGLPLRDRLPIWRRRTRNYTRCVM